MIRRRLYLLVPNLGQAEASARDLMAYRVNRHHIHAIRPGADLGSLPVANVYLGYRIAQQVPHTHVEDCQTPLCHGAILLLVDVPRWRITEVEQRLRASHPEVEIGGVGWGWDAIGI
ncbi:MAG: hypothetical protein P8Z77_12815 [Candidatus Thiodiazotropha sp.]